MKIMMCLLLLLTSISSFATEAKVHPHVVASVELMIQSLNTAPDKGCAKLSNYLGQVYSFGLLLGAVSEANIDDYGFQVAFKAKSLRYIGLNARFVSSTENICDKVHPQLIKDALVELKEISAILKNESNLK